MKTKEEIAEETKEEEITDESEESKEEESTKEEEESEEEEEEEGEGDEIDYKAEHERLEGELATKNERIAKQDKKIIKLKKKSKEENEEEEEEADVNTLVQEEVKKQMTNFVQDTIDQELDKVSSNPDEKKLIKWYFDNRIIKDGWSKKEVEGYISDAYTLANKGKVLAKSKIISKKIKSDDTAGSPSVAGNPPKSSKKITDYDRKQADKFFGGDVKKWMKFKPSN